MQVAIKCDGGIVYFQTLLPLYVLFSQKGKIAQDLWLSNWQLLSNKENIVTVPSTKANSMDQIRTKFELNNIYLIAERAIQNTICLYISVSLLDDQLFLCEIRFEANFSSYVISTRSNAEHFIKPISEAIQVIINN